MGYNKGTAVEAIVVFEAMKDSKPDSCLKAQVEQYRFDNGSYEFRDRVAEIALALSMLDEATHLEPCYKRMRLDKCDYEFELVPDLLEELARCHESKMWNMTADMIVGSLATLRRS